MTIDEIDCITIAHTERGVGRTLVWARIALSDGSERTERFSAAADFIFWDQENKEGWVREMMARRLEHEAESIKNACPEPIQCPPRASL